MYQTDMYEGMLAETTTVRGHNGEAIGAYMARPLGPGPHPGMVLIHHAPGWDEWYRETARRFAHHGYVTISPNLYHRAGHGDPREIGVKVRGVGGHIRRAGPGGHRRLDAVFAVAALPEREGRAFRHLLRREAHVPVRLPHPGVRRGGGLLGRGG